MQWIWSLQLGIRHRMNRKGRADANEDLRKILTWRFGSMIESMNAGGGRLVHPACHQGDWNA